MLVYKRKNNYPIFATENDFYYSTAEQIFAKNLAKKNPLILGGNYFVKSLAKEVLLYREGII